MAQEAMEVDREGTPERPVNAEAREGAAASEAPFMPATSRSSWGTFVGERESQRPPPQPPPRREPLRRRRRRGQPGARAPQRAARARPTAPLDSYFQVSRTQATVSSHLSPGRNRHSSDETVALSDSDSSSSSSSSRFSEEEEEQEPARALEEASRPANLGVSDLTGMDSLEDNSGEPKPSDIGGAAACQKTAAAFKKTNPDAPLVTPEEEESGDTCAICFEEWTNAGDHRLAALRCGHLFGYSCIERWLKGQAGKCPQCNKKAKRSDIVVLYARTLKALDTSEKEHMKSSLEKEQILRRKAELESAQSRLQLQVLTDECSKLRQQVQELKTLMARHSTSFSQQPSNSHSCFPASSQGQHKYQFERAMLVSQVGNCRVMAYCDPLSCLVVSQPSPQSTLIPGCGIKMMSAVNLKSSQYVPIHSKQIRGLAFSNRTDGLLLSAALDHTLRLTSLATNTVVQTYNTGRPVWSCCWCLDDTNYVYAGLVNGSVLVYDLRDTNAHVQELAPQKSRSQKWVLEDYCLSPWPLNSAPSPMVFNIYMKLLDASPPLAHVFGLFAQHHDCHVNKRVVKGDKAGNKECPVVSLSYLPRMASAALPYGGLVSGTLEGACFWEWKASNSYRPHHLLLEPGGCIDLQTEASTRHCLATFRPNRNHNSLRCVVMELSCTQLTDTADDVVCSCHPIQTLNAGPTCKLLTKNAIFQSPEDDDSIFVCAGDEASNSAMLWDAGTGSLLQKLSADLPVLDVCPYEVNRSSFLATLTEKMVKIYKWQ